ncbi:type VI secretion system tube protein Hcp [Paucibacter sp. AS339]|uniref:Hcp family type VI secretion system effector n=1 Tax=Paucibacter hankyongi TaxID=3133434 RepID=UPI0030ABDF80
MKDSKHVVTGVSTGLMRPLLAGSLALASAGSALAASDMFLFLDGIKGESTDAKHKDWIDLKSYSLGFSRSDTLGSGGGGMGKVNCGDVSVLKTIDSSSPRLMQAVMLGERVGKATISFRAGSTGKASSSVDYYTVDMAGVQVDSVAQSDASGDASRVTESVSLRAEKFHFSYRTQLPDGSFSPPKVFDFDCMSGKGS